MAGLGACPEMDRPEKSKTTGQFGNLTGNRESDRQCLIFEKVTGQCRLEHVIRTHVAVVGRVDAGAHLRVS
jgi:hypothetical protein